MLRSEVCWAVYLDVKRKVVKFQVLHEGSFDAPFLRDERLARFIEGDHQEGALLGLADRVLDEHLGVPVRREVRRAGRLERQRKTSEKGWSFQSNWKAVEKPFVLGWFHILFSSQGKYSRMLMESDYFCICCETHFKVADAGSIAFVSWN